MSRQSNLLNYKGWIMNSLKDLLEEYREISPRRERVMMLIKEKLTLTHGKFTFIPFMLPPTIEKITPFVLNDTYDALDFGVGYTQFDRNGELIRDFITHKILTKENIEEVLKDL